MGFSRQEYWVGCHALLQGIFLTQGSNPGLLHCRRILCYLSHQGSPRHYRNRSKKAERWPLIACPLTSSKNQDWQEDSFPLCNYVEGAPAKQGDFCALVFKSRMPWMLHAQLIIRFNISHCSEETGSLDFRYKKITSGYLLFIHCCWCLVNLGRSQWKATVRRVEVARGVMSALKQCGREKLLSSVGKDYVIWIGPRSSLSWFPCLQLHPVSVLVKD